MIFADIKTNAMTISGDGNDILSEFVALISLLIIKSDANKEQVKEIFTGEEFWDHVGRIDKKDVKDKKMIFVDLKSKTVITKGRLDRVMDEALNAITKIAEDGGKSAKEDLREILMSDKFWDNIECDEDEEE